MTDNLTHMKRATFFTSIRHALLFLLLLGSAVAQKPATADLSAQIDRIVTDEMKKQQIPAMTVAVMENGKMIYSKAFGAADLENDLPATTGTLIRTGSIAKPISAAAAMTLVEAGKIDLDAPVQKYCPAFPEKQWPVTTREVLNHTSGIRHYKESEVGSTNHFNSMSDGFTIFAADPLLFEPGTKFSYSTYGYTVVGCVIEGASGQKYFDYVRDHVLTPAHMTHTFVDNVFDIVPHRARGYQKMNGQVKNAGLMDSSYKLPGGGLVTTAEDLVLFATAMMDDKIVKAETLAAMWSPTKLRDGQNSPYGLGFGVLMPGGEKFVTHGGSQQGTTTTLAMVPGKHFAVAALANMDGVNPGVVTNGILDLYQMPRPGK